MDHIRINRKQNIFRALAAIILVNAAFLPCLAQAGEIVKTNTPLPVSAPVMSGPLGVLDEWLKSVRDRDRTRAFSFLSNGLHDKYQKSERVFMNTVRLTQHALYDHQTYRLLTPVSPTADRPEMLVKIQWIDRDGHETLGLIRMIRGDKGGWRVDGVTVLEGGRARDA